MTGRLFLVLIAASLLLSTPAGTDPLWTSESASPYSVQKNFKAGDIITVLILESSSALSQAGTDTGVKDDLSLRFNHTMERLYSDVGPRNEVLLKGENKYKGIGKTTRASNIQAKVAAIVTKVFDNGNLAILGNHRVEVNRERQDITITGIIRSRDVTSSNTVYSFQVAQANIAIKGEGAVAEAESPGWFTRVINWLF